jgi:mannose-6-phosphate isomerase-like protein (cupin superfamily)
MNEPRTDVRLSMTANADNPHGAARLELRLVNAFNDETFVFPIGENEPAVARFDVLLAPGGSGGGNALVHVHPGASETFTVKSGRLAVVMGGVERFAEPGQSITIPAGTPHHFRNADAGPTAATVAFEPAQQHLSFFKNFATLAQNRPQWFSAKGDPHLLLIALVLHRYRGHLYLAGIPIFVQKLLFAALSPLARLRGYRLAIEPLPSGSRR